MAARHLGRGTRNLPTREVERRGKECGQRSKEQCPAELRQQDNSQRGNIPKLLECDHRGQASSTDNVMRIKLLCLQLFPCNQLRRLSEVVTMRFEVLCAVSTVSPSSDPCSLTCSGYLGLRSLVSVQAVPVAYTSLKAVSWAILCLV